ncbi:hypothetical protein [Marinoscillum furvescens]|uniref:Acetyltransferase (GNAT) family protein n=1 Tax=Marinoscillum furvescens DSM 4134 TaxID=1122208 RepID=A0A3D9KYM2_MARFU|nr:hypothetical protein [Marinoscillum furvescens]RED94903.1 hypothetical protein C7460_11914 [Marinoscillum furvescens DSM 4134]
MRLLELKRGEPDSSIKELLTHNVIGTPGKSMVYQQLCVRDKLDHIPDPYFLSVRLAERVVGTSCFIRRAVAVGAHTLEAFHIRYFAFRTQFRSNDAALGRLNKKSALRNEISDVLEGKPFGLSSSPLSYAYVDPGNVRSLRIIESYGFQHVGNFNTVFFSRFAPKANPDVSRVSENEESEVKALIGDAYANHALYTSENIGYKGGLFVLQKQGTIVAALQANPEHWKVHELPGSKHLIHMVSRIPFINRLFHRDFRFLSIEGIYVKSGHEKQLEKLISGVLAQTGRHTAIMCLDPKSQEYQLMQRQNRGFIRLLINEKKLYVMARGPKEVLDSLRQHPIYVSAFDNM